MSKMKKFLKSFLVFAVITVGIFAFTGCGKKENKQQNQEAYLEPLTNYFEGIKTKDINKGKECIKIEFNVTLFRRTPYT